jgi:membrane-associated protease RseP (regulator of RpoE activity)
MRPFTNHRWKLQAACWLVYLAICTPISAQSDAHSHIPQIAESRWGIGPEAIDPHSADHPDDVRWEWGGSDRDDRAHPGRRTIRSRWLLGASCERAPIGLRITGITADTPAAREGLEIGDYIVAIGGLAVGDFEGQYYPLEQSMDAAADRRGRTHLIIWNKRSFQFEKMNVQFQRQ